MASARYSRAAPRETGASADPLVYGLPIFIGRNVVGVRGRHVFFFDDFHPDQGFLGLDRLIKTNVRPLLALGFGHKDVAVEHPEAGLFLRHPVARVAELLEEVVPLLTQSVFFRPGLRAPIAH